MRKWSALLISGWAEMQARWAGLTSTLGMVWYGGYCYILAMQASLGNNVI